nr:MAG TPA: hypothetical protein [Caudoviricetes sp.]
MRNKCLNCKYHNITNPSAGTERVVKKYRTHLFYDNITVQIFQLFFAKLFELGGDSFELGLDCRSSRSHARGCNYRQATCQRSGNIQHISIYRSS